MNRGRRKQLFKQPTRKLDDEDDAVPEDEIDDLGEDTAFESLVQEAEQNNEISECNFNSFSKKSKVQKKLLVKLPCFKSGHRTNQKANDFNGESEQNPDNEEIKLEQHAEITN